MNRFPEALNNYGPAGNPPCECGHEYEDHDDLGFCLEDIRGCSCQQYVEFDEYAAAEEASLRRAEMRGEWRT